MKRNDDFILLPLDDVLGTYVLNPTAKVAQEKTGANPLILEANITVTSTTFTGLIIINSTGKDIWDLFAGGAELTEDEVVTAIYNIYESDVDADGNEITEELIRPKISAFVQSLYEAHALVD